MNRIRKKETWKSTKDPTPNSDLELNRPKFDSPGLRERSPGMDAWFPPLSFFPDFILFLRYIFSENALNLDILAAEELGVQCTCFKVLERSSSLGSSVRFCFQVMSFRYRSVRLSATLWHITYYHDTGLEKYHFNIFRNETTLLFVWDWWFLEETSSVDYVRPSA